MMADETLIRVREIMDENKIPRDEGKELEMAIVYSQAAIDTIKENIISIKKAK